MNKRRAQRPADSPPRQSEAVCDEKVWPTVADCRHRAVHQRRLFVPQRGPDFDYVFLPICNATLPAQTVIYREGQETDAFYTLRQGLVNLIKRAPNGVGRIGCGDRWSPELGAGTVAERLRWLVRLLAESDAAEGRLSKLPSMSALVAILGSSIESICRILAQLKWDNTLGRVPPRAYCDLQGLP